MSESAAKSRLNSRQLRFVELVASGMAHGRAYEQAGYAARGNSADSCAEKLLRKAEVAERLAELRKESRQVAKITRNELVSALTAIVRSKPGDASMANPLCELRMSKAGPYAAFPDKARCIERLCKMLGYDEPERHVGKITVVIGGNADE